ncbi:MAG: HEAT repeat domain-containing protein [Acidobacteria bacterium]|nr:HEAT repeat domain-containing protein [Acidobacteriota bacterium]
MSKALDRFLVSFSSRDQAWFDGYDLDALAAIDVAERAQVEHLLVARLAERDARAARALVAFGSPAALDALRRSLPGSGGELRVEVATALATLTGFDASHAIIEVLADREPFHRIAAALALRACPSSKTFAALLQTAAHDPHRDVRTMAATSLLLAAGVLESPLDISQRELMMRLDADDPAVVSAAAVELAALVKSRLS